MMDVFQSEYCVKVLCAILMKIRELWQDVSVMGHNVELTVHTAQMFCLRNGVRTKRGKEEERRDFRGFVRQNLSRQR